MCVERDDLNMVGDGILDIVPLAIEERGLEVCSPGFGNWGQGDGDVTPVPCKNPNRILIRRVEERDDRAVSK